MPLTLITGRANTGKTGRALSIYRESLAAGGRPILVLPSEPDVERAVRELAGESPLGVDARTFARLIAGLWEANGDGRAIVTPSQRRALLSSLLEVEGAGHVRLVERVVQHLSVSGEAWRTGDTITGDCERIAEATRAYGGELTRRGLLEPGEAARHAEQFVVAGDTIIFHRFVSLTPSEESFAKQAGQGDAQLAVTLTWEKGFPATEAIDSTIEHLISGATHEHVAATTAHTDEPELARIEAELFQRPELVEGTGAVAFLMAEGPEAEADIIAGHVLDLVDEGLSPERIAVVFRSPGDRAGSLRRAFAEAGLRIDLDVARPLNATPLGQAFTHAVAFLTHGDRGALLALMRSGYYCADGADAQSMMAQWLKNAVFATDHLIEGATSLDSVNGRLLARLRTKSLSGAEQAATWDELAAEMFARKHRERSSALELPEDAAARSAISRMLADLVDLEDAALDPYSLLQVLEGVRIGVRETERAGCVQVTSAERVRGRRFDAVVLGGLNAGEFPVTTEDPLNSDALLPLWKAAGTARPPRTEAASERAMLYTVVTRPRKRLTLSRLVSGAGGEDLAPSVFWEELRDFYREPIEGTDAGPLPQDHLLKMHEAGLVAHAASSLRADLRAAACEFGRGDPPPTVISRITSAASRVRRHEAWQLTRPAGASLPDTFSPSALELYARCPYLWFVNREISGERLEFEVDALTRGSLAHAALERAYRGQAGTRVADGKTDGELADLASEVVSAAIQAGGLPREEHHALAIDLVPRVHRSLRADAAFSPRLLPWATEWSFGGEEDPRVSLGPYQLRGRIDRVDADGKRAAIIDYKLGSSGPYSAAKIREHTTIQALLYAYAVEKATDLVVDAALYRGLADGETRGVASADMPETAGIKRTDLAAEDEYREAIEWAVQEALQAAEGIRAGQLGRRGGVHCRYCPVARWCEERE